MTFANTPFTDPRHIVLAKIFGPLIDFLEIHKITGMLAGFILMSFGLYLNIFYKREKGKKVSFSEIIVILAWCIVSLITIEDQIDIMNGRPYTPPWQGRPLPKIEKKVKLGNFQISRNTNSITKETDKK